MGDHKDTNPFGGSHGDHIGPPGASPDVRVRAEYRLEANCYRVLMLDPDQLLHWWPVIVAQSVEDAKERALTMFPHREIIDVTLAHGQHE